MISSAVGPGCVKTRLRFPKLLLINSADTNAAISEYFSVLRLEVTSFRANVGGRRCRH